MSDLELDHDPPLEEHERTDPAIVCNPARVAFLCKSDHSAKTGDERGRRQPGASGAYATHHRAMHPTRWATPTTGGESKS